LILFLPTSQQQNCYPRDRAFRFKTVNGDIVTHANISHVEDKLPAGLFIRIHRPFIVPMQKIQKFTSSSIEINGLELPIGRLYKARVYNILSAISSI
jgi:DNA-binding LytR/AlgR family response regulator